MRERRWVLLTDGELAELLSRAEHGLSQAEIEELVDERDTITGSRRVEDVLGRDQ